MIQLLRGNSSTLNASQQIFAEGQPIFEKDTQKLKIGNGVDTYSVLKYIGNNISGSVERANQSTRGYIDFTEHLRYSFGKSSIDTSSTLDNVVYWEATNGERFLSFSSSLSFDYPFTEFNCYPRILSVNFTPCNRGVWITDCYYFCSTSWTNSEIRISFAGLESKVNSSVPFTYQIWSTDSSNWLN